MLTRALAYALAVALLAAAGLGFLYHRQTGALAVKTEALKSAVAAQKRSDKASARLAADRLALARSEALLRQRLDAALALPKNTEWANATVPQEVRDALE